jgi:hypothetical protein
MRLRLCPLCAKPGRFLPDSSADAYVEYYRCDTCHAVWCYNLSTPDMRPNSVTLPRAQKAEAETKGGDGSPGQ